MAGEATISIVVLWEEELRQAAELFDAFEDLPNDAPEEEKQRVALAAFDAASVALAGLKPNTSVVMISNRTVAKQAE